MVGAKESTFVGAVSKALFTDEQQTIYLHTVDLKNLKPGSLYEYRVRFTWEKFHTEDGGKFKAIIFPDSQSRDYSSWQGLVRKAWLLNQDANFFVNMGDIVDNGADDGQWRQWREALPEHMIARIPFVPVLGNHETYTLDWKTQLPNRFLTLFPMPGNGDPMYQNQYYSFDYGDVHFVVFNSQFDEMEPFLPELKIKEMEWLEKDLASTDKKWKVVLMHKNLFAFKKKLQGDSLSTEFMELGHLLMPIFDKYHVDAVLTAHLHTYRRRQQVYQFQPNPKGTLYIVTGVAGDVRYPELWQRHELDIARAPEPETNNYITLEADENYLKFAAFLPSGEKFDEIELKK